MKHGLHLVVATHFAHQKFAREKRTQGCSKTERTNLINNKHIN